MSSDAARFGSASVTQLPPGTYTVSQLGEELKEILTQTLGGLWVAGEVRRPTLSRGGHLYFQLVEKDGRDGVRGAVDAVLFRRDLQRVRRTMQRAGMELEEGQTIRCFGGLDYYPPAGRLQLIARDVDPLFSLGEMARRREQTLRRLAESGLLERNAGLLFPLLPLRIALVTSLGSAAERDFTTTLEASPFAFAVSGVDVAVQGPAAERSLAAAISSVRAEFDVVVVIRGGGSRSDLAAFDSLAVSEAIARCPVPVLTGLGHEIDRSIADRVGHRSFKTPTAVAEHLVAVLGELDRRLTGARRDLAAAARARLRSADHDLARAELGLRAGERRLRRASERLERAASRLERAVRVTARLQAQRLDELEGRLRRAVRPTLERPRLSIESCARRLLVASRRRLRSEGERLDQQARWIEQLSPARTLRRGFSITRDADGRALRDARDVEAEQEVVTELASGELRSRVLGS